MISRPYKLAYATVNVPTPTPTVPAAPKFSWTNLVNFLFGRGVQTTGSGKIATTVTEKAPGEVVGKAKEPLEKMLLEWARRLDGNQTVQEVAKSGQNWTDYVKSVIRPLPIPSDLQAWLVGWGTLGTADVYGIRKEFAEEDARKKAAGIPAGQKCRRFNDNCQFCDYGGDKRGYCWTNKPCGSSKKVTWCSKGSSSCAQPRDIWIRKYGCKTGTSTSSTASACRRVNSNCVYCNYGGDKKGYCWTNNPCNSSKKVTWCTKGSSSCDKPRSIWLSKYGCTGAGFKSGSSGNCSWDTKGGWCWKSTACKKPCKACINNYKTRDINAGCKKVRSYFINNSRKCPGCKSSSGSGSGSSGGFRCPYSGCGSTKSKSQCFLCRCRGRCNSAKCGGVKTVKSDGSCFCNRSC